MIIRYIILVITFFLSAFAAVSQKPMPPEKQTQIDNYLKQANEAEYKGDFKKAANVIKSVADIYYKYYNYNKAIELYQKSILYSEKIGDQKAIAFNYTNIGVMFFNLDNGDKVLEMWRKSLDIRRKLPNKEDLSSGLYDYAWINYRIKKYEEAIQRAQEGLDIAKNINNSNLILNFYRLLSDCYTETGNKKLAQSFKTDAEYLANFMQDQKKKELDKRKDIVAQTKILETEGRIKEEQLKIENLILKQKALKDSNEKVQIIYQTLRVQDSLSIAVINAQKKGEQEKFAKLAAESSKNRMFLIASFVTIGLVLLLAGFIFYRLLERRPTLKKLKLQNEEIVVQKNEVDNKKKELEGAFKKIERQNIEIISSIGYASRIQTAILAPPDELSHHLPESFVLFKPRDIVSGDYYWFNKVTATGNGNGSPVGHPEEHQEPVSKIVVSAIDCTGHGVPGAMLSMVANNLLHQIVVKDQIHDPGLILEKVNRGVRKILKQDTTKSRDGMDMSVAIINEKEKYVEFSGAKSPLVYMQDGEMQFIKGDFEGIGGLQMETVKKYETIRISVDKPTVFYQFSDGYGDQFGGDKGKKLMSRGFRDLLAEFHKLPMKEQKELLDHKFMQWKGRFEQVDDILVIGYKVGF